MRVVKLKEFIHLPVGHWYAPVESAGEPPFYSVTAGDMYCKTHQYFNAEGAPVNDWCKYPISGASLHEDGIFKDDPNCPTQLINTNYETREGVYPPDESEYVVFSDADMLVGTISHMVNLVTMFKVFGSDGPVDNEHSVWAHRYNDLAKALAWEINDAHGPYTEFDPVRVHACRRILMWMITAIRPQNEIKAIGVKLCIRTLYSEPTVSKPIGFDLNTALQEVIDAYSIPEVAKIDSDLRQLYHTTPQNSKGPSSDN